MVLSNYLIYSTAPFKVIALYLICLIFGIIFLFHAFISLSIVIALPTIAKVVALKGDSNKFPLLFAVALREQYRKKKH